MHGIHPSMQYGGAVERPGNRPSAMPTAESTTTTTGPTAVADEVTLSPEAKAFMANSGPGNSRAHEARATIASNPALAGMSFGKIVSGLNHGVDFAAMSSEESNEVPADGTETASVPADGTETASVAPPTDTPDATAPATEEVSSPVAPITTEDSVPPVADGSDNGVVIAPATDGADGTATTEDVVVASTVPGDVDMFPDVEPLIEIDDGKSLLEELTDAIEEANGEDPDTTEGINIAA